MLLTAVSARLRACVCMRICICTCVRACVSACVCIPFVTRVRVREKERHFYHCRAMLRALLRFYRFDVERQLVDFSTGGNAEVTKPGAPGAG